MKKILITAMMALSFLSNADESCLYPDKTDNGIFSHAEKCGLITGDSIKLNKIISDNIFYNEKGLACILSAKDTFYSHKNGASQRVHFYDNGCDYFKEGLARGIVNGKMVFINQQLDIILSPGFERLSPFDYDHAVVCNGPFQEEKHGEHTLLKGGKCGLIDKQGTLVVEAIHKIGDRAIFQAYINNNNHCPAPPIASKKSALCHGKRHAKNMEHHTDQWKKYEISKRGNIWIITFIEEGKTNQAFTLTLSANSAEWKSLIQETHSKALQRAAADKGIK